MYCPKCGHVVSELSFDYKNWSYFCLNCYKSSDIELLFGDVVGALSLCENIGGELSITTDFT